MRGKDRGAVLTEILIGMAVGIIVLGGGALFFVNVNKNNANNAALQEKNTSISQALDRASQHVQVAGTILTAAPNELIISSSEPGSDEQVINRWVKSGTTFYQQTWTGAANAYPFTSGAWIAVSNKGAAAPNGDGKQVTRVSVTDLKADAPAVFTYYGVDGTALSVSPALSAKDGGTTAIKRIAIKLKASVGTAGTAENATSASLRNGTGGVSDGAAAAPLCPVLSFDERDKTKPVLRWTVVPGYRDYVIYRNAAAAATVNVASGKTVGTWTDTTNPAAAGDAVTYTVYTKAADGTLSSGCRPAIWRAQIAAPAWKATSVLPSSPESTGWSTGAHASLKQPRIVISWGAVPGASGYELKYREVNASTGAAIAGKTQFLQAPGFTAGTNTTTYTWDGGGWGKRYEWYVEASALSGQSNKSTTIQTLTHPAAPAGLNSKAEYGTGADKNTTGRNILTWKASPTANSYEIWRYANKATSGTATKVGTTTALTYTDKAAYGTKYAYYVVAKNNGPRGVDAAQAVVTDVRSSANPESGASSKAAVKAQLQFPPIPKMVPAGPNGTRDLEGSNKILWNEADSADGYAVWKVAAQGTNVVATCLVTSCSAEAPKGVQAESFNEKAAPGTKFWYFVKAYNGTGLSVDFSAKEPVTQRPAAPVLKVTRQPDLSSPAASFSVVPNADAGNGSGARFCTELTCSYQLYKDGKAHDVAMTEKPGKSTVDWTNIANAEGATIGYSAKSRNEAFTKEGWSDEAKVTINTYPGQFAVLDWAGDANGNKADRFNLDLRNIEIGGSSYGAVQNGYSTVTWARSAGASTFTLKRASLANDNTGSSKGLPSGANLTKTINSGAGGTWSEIAAPGATYRYELSAKAPNGLVRTVNNRASFTTPADLPREGKQIVVCSTAAWNAPQLVSAKLIDFQHTPRYGAWKGVSVRGLEHISPDNKGWVESSSTTVNPGSVAREILTSNGTAYYKGFAFGHDLWTNGNGGPNSARLRLSLVAMAQQGIGCGPAGQGGNAMKEPTYPCYGYVEGTTCVAVNEHNRPRWVTN
ncbi:hypothetical protein [Arthrobacter caoxuetaonis]|uniref:Fibronectin type III domain-containing protein n=1 Tax=Arthrobacter caoxuetaonis TaxID=2886935 RepID=A0A9X1SDJ5_9MICC|nr:hypothetical protein [Arthrobacter caoxuetaonis]MCC3299263.1 hypothetical protein [Arthrobacter caoxuetaonis]USQ59243.1 hypothetical protein NF551_16805 [Arthrobacter caoxuetaonis]